VIKNAIKFSKNQGKLIVRLLNDDAESVRLEVQDFGMGIDPRLLPRIFNAFEQGDSTLPSQGGGLGLGLTIARAIVEMHGGAMSARSDGIDQGATISVTLPLTSREVQLREVLKSAEGVDSDVSSMRVLLVEDHKDTAVVLGKHLEHCGHSVKIAGSVASALEAASAEPFDLIIADIGLPDGTGHDLMRQIKVRHTIPAIALTGYGMEDDLSRSREAGFAEHIVKPVDLSHLQSAIARVAGKKTVS
jgi:CheY-like chemotaxis protein